MSEPMIKIGQSPEAIEQARLGVIDIILSANSDQVKLAALDALAKVCAINASVSNCTFAAKE